MLLLIFAHAILDRLREHHSRESVDSNAQCYMYNLDGMKMRNLPPTLYVSALLSRFGSSYTISRCVHFPSFAAIRISYIHTALAVQVAWPLCASHMPSQRANSIFHITMYEYTYTNTNTHV